MSIPSYQRKEKPFDILVTNTDCKKSLGIEVSFQVTTNSTIERKANEAEKTYQLVKSVNNFLAYVIDGAGNFQRKSAIETLCRYSDCNVAYSDNELKLLSQFIIKNIK